jgi:hypothetical protein
LDSAGFAGSGKTAIPEKSVVSNKDGSTSRAPSGAPILPSAFNFDGQAAAEYDLREERTMWLVRFFAYIGGSALFAGHVEISYQNPEYAVGYLVSSILACALFETMWQREKSVKSS